MCGGVSEVHWYTTVFPLVKKSEVTSTLIRWLLATEGTRGSRVRCLHSDRGGEFRSGVLTGFCGEQGIRQSWMLSESPQQNGVAKRRNGLVMDIARTSMIHAPAPHFLWPYALRFAAHQLNLQPRVSRPEVTVDSVGVGTGGATTGGTRSRGARLRGAGAGGAGAGGASPGRAGAGGAGTGGASSGARGAGSGGASSRGAGAGGAGAVGAGTEEKGAGGSPTALPTALPHCHDTRFQALRWLEREEQEHGLWVLGLPSSPPVHSHSPTAYGPTFPAPDSTPAVFSPPQSQLPPPVVRHDWPRRCPPRARPSSPLADLRTVLFRFLPRRSLIVPVLPSPPVSSLTVSSHPITDYYRAARPVVSRVLASLVTDPRASPSSVSTLIAAIDDFASTRRLDYATRVVAAPPPHPLSVGGESALGCDVLEDRSTGTYVDAVPPLRTDDGMWLFKVKRPPGSLPVFKARYVDRGFSQHEGVDFFHTFGPTSKMTTLWVLLHVAAQRDYELHSLDFSTVFLEGRLHEEIWLRRPLGFTDTFPRGTQWSLRRPVYGLRQSPREWHDTLCSTLRDLGFRTSSADPSLFVRTGFTPFFILVYVDDLVFATADRAALTEVKSELQMRHTCTNLGDLHRYLGLQINKDKATRTITQTQAHMVQQVLRRFGFQFSTTQPTPLAVDHRLTGPFPDEPFDSSGPYAELAGCLMYLMTCTRPDLAFPLSVLSCFVATVRHCPVHWTATTRVAKYLAC
ncbi:unnamed protein product [Closterium sp. NIES-53]